MADCIDRQALYEAIRQLADETECNIAVLPDMAEKIREAPAADVAPVVHGRWEDVQETEMYVPDMKFTTAKTAETCSECKARIGFIGAKRYLFDSVCPNCGAKMDLEAT